MKYKEVNLDYNPNERDQRGKKHAYTMYFCYPKVGPPTVVKGSSDTVEKYVKDYLTPCIYYYSFWKDGKSRGNWRASRGIYIFIDKINIKAKSRKLYRIRIHRKNNETLELLVRRIPKKWLTIYNEASRRETF